MHSIRIYLIAVVLATVTLFNFIAALRGYQSSLVEAELLFDSQLLDSARIIANIDPKPTAKTVNPTGDIAFQIWHDGQLLLSSSNAPGAAIGPLAPGFDHSNFGGYRWRTLAYYEPSRNNWILVAQRTDLRYALAENVVLESISPILIGLPLVALLIWMLITRGLKPLRQLADGLGSKQPDDLSPLAINAPWLEIDQIVKSSNTLLARLETSLLRERRFASDAAHELRTPISALKVQLYNLRDELPPEDENITQLTATAERLENIVEQILDLYRNSSDQYHAAFTDINLAALIQQAMANAHADFDRKNQSLEFDGDSCFIRGDHFALTTLVQNLLSNANKYTPAGGEVRVALKFDDDTATVTVEDSGPGIPAELRHAVFDRFYRAGGDRHASKQPGSGLGLAIVKVIADLHSASIAITDSTFATGAAFHVTLPRNSFGTPDNSTIPKPA